MSPGFLPCWWLLSVEPTDRALAGWCPLPPLLDSERSARSYLLAQDSGGGMLPGDCR